MNAHPHNLPIQSTSGLQTLLASRIQANRLARNWTQKQLAFESGISLATLRRLEAGRSVQFEHWLSVVRALALEDALLQAFPDKLASPMQVLKSQKAPRKRASSKPQMRAAAPAPARGSDGATSDTQSAGDLKTRPNAGWTWGDEMPGGPR